MIVSSGYCIYPQYIENVIDGHKDVLMSCVIGISHPYKVQVAKAFIVLKDPSKENEETLQSIKEHCEKNLSRFSWPYEYEFRDELPKTLVGKVAYNVLIHEEEAKNKNRVFEKDDSKTITMEVISDDIIDMNLKEFIRKNALTTSLMDNIDLLSSADNERSSEKYQKIVDKCLANFDKVQKTLNKWRKLVRKKKQFMQKTNDKQGKNHI
jgi:ElaB/YqjD/DUF883 family membrane-anchored ribosome-binding protein